MTRFTHTHATLLPDAFDDLPPPERLSIDLAAARHPEYSSGPGMIVVNVPVFHCGACEQPIARGNVLIVAQDQPSPADPLKRIARGYCEHCKLLHEVTVTLDGGAWRQAGPGQIVTDPRIKDQHLRKVKRIASSLGYGPAA